MKRPISNHRLATVVVRTIIAVTAIVYLAFYLVGFNLPYLFNPQQNAPLLTGVVVTFVLLLLGITIAAVVWSLLRQWRTNPQQQANESPMLRRKRTLTRWAIVATVAVTLLLTYILASTQPLIINNEHFGNALQLRMANMFTATTIVCIILAVASVAYSRIVNKQ